MKSAFFKQPWVLCQDGAFSEDKEEIQVEFEEIGLLKQHHEVVSKMPDRAVLLGSSNRTHHEMWMIPDQVLCFQASPEINVTFMKAIPRPVRDSSTPVPLSPTRPMPFAMNVPIWLRPQATTLTSVC